jgi:LysM repeat protein/lysophospholipase L1-like esterase
MIFAYPGLVSRICRLLERQTYGKLVLCMLSPVVGSLFLQCSYQASVVAQHTGTYPAVPSDSVLSVGYIHRQVNHATRYPHIVYDSNFVSWNHPAAIAPIYEALMKAPTRKVTVLHIGDSHVQADIYTGEVRHRLQKVFGAGGRGLIFPYACAKTHPGNDYFTYSRGVWTSARNVSLVPAHDLGATGVTIRTGDPMAGFRIVFNKFHNDENNRILKIYYKPSQKSFSLIVKINQNPNAIKISLSDSLRPYVQIPLPESPQVLDVQVQRTSPEQSFFECYGLSLETDQNSGILYHSVGINGAGLTSVLKQNLLPEHLAVLKPDLIVFDLYGNEFHGPNPLDAEDFKTKYKNIVRIFRSSAPQAAILLTTAQEVYYRRAYPVPAERQAVEVVRQVASELECAFYHYYQVAGGYGSMSHWRAHELAQPDKIHLTYAGYLTKAELFTNSFLTAYAQYLLGNRYLPFPKQYLAEPKFNAQAASLPVVPVSKPTPVAVHQPTREPAVSVIRYSVKPGDYLAKIAQAYGVTVRLLQQWNNLSTAYLRVGQVLLIYRNATNPVQSAVPPKPSANAAKAGSSNSEVVRPSVTSPTKKVYVVRSGDSLWGIARKYGVSVDALMKANKLGNSRLNVGQKLTIP